MKKEWINAIFRSNFRILALLTAALTVGLQLTAAPQGGVNTVVIDAGHGGHDPGTVSKLYKEKDITLKVALKLGALINHYYPGVKVVYTRSTDVFIPLDQRGRIANNAKADLFISIHVNANKSASPSGFETYVMGVGKSSNNLEVAMRENDVITYEQDYSTKYSGYEPGSAESFIIFSLMQYSYLEQSLLFADMVQKEYAGRVRIPNRGVKQAGFLVLWHTAMPSILTELGFLSNPGDEKILASAVGQENYAKAIFNAFSVFKTKTDGKGAVIVATESESSVAFTRGESAQDADTSAPATAAQTATQTAAAPAAERPAQAQTQVQAGQTARPEIPASTAGIPSSTVSTGASQQGITFAVQIKLSNKKLHPDSPVFGPWAGKVSEKLIGNLYKYYINESASYNNALESQKEARKTFPDAFVVAFQDGKPTNLAEAIKKSKL